MKQTMTSIVLSAGLLLLGSAGVAHAAPYLVSITGFWSANDFSTGSKPDSDGKVFGLDPHDGALTVDLLVDTDSAVSYAAGYTYNHLGVNYTLTHDWYGYSNVSLVGGSGAFGDASWTTSDIIGLDGVDDLSRALWTDADIAGNAVTRASFRMMGTYGGGSEIADMFFGSRTPSTITESFLAWEYYQGDEIRSNQYSVATRAVSEPASLLLLGAGLTALGGLRSGRKSKV